MFFITLVKRVCNFINELKCRQEEFEDTKELIRISKSKKDRQHNGQKTKDKTTIYKTYTYN